MVGLNCLFNPVNQLNFMFMPTYGLQENERSGRDKACQYNEGDDTNSHVASVMEAAPAIMFLHYSLAPAIYAMGDKSKMMGVF